MGGGRGIVFAGQKSVSMDRHYFESTPRELIISATARNT